MFGDDFFDDPTGGLFDLNRDGKMDAGERALEYDFMEPFVDDDDDEDEDVDDLDLELSEDDELREALEDAGLDAFELSNIDEDTYDDITGAEILMSKRSSIIANEIERLYLKAKKILADNRSFLDNIAAELLARQTLTCKDIAAIRDRIS